MKSNITRLMHSSIKAFKVGLLFFTLMLLYPAYSFIQAQRPRLQKNTSNENWLTSQKAFEARWRYGLGSYTGVATGLDFEMFKLSNICTRRVNATKQLSVDISLLKEALMFSPVLKEKNTGYDNPGFRYGLGIKYHFYGVYAGAGIEGGNRVMNGLKAYSTDLVLRLGIEGKIYGFQQGQHNLLHFSWFIDGKYNKSLAHDFTYFLPVIGVRVNFL